MRKSIIALAAGLMAVSALPAVSTAQERPYTAGPMQNHGMQDNDRNSDHDRRDTDRWGRWDTHWGARPAAPPRHWRRSSDWYRHVHACQVRYRSYNPSRDMYRTRTAWVRCRL